MNGVFLNTCHIASFEEMLCYTSRYYGIKQLHVSPNFPPGLRCIQGCGFWADINGASAGSETEIRQKTWWQLEDLEGSREDMEKQT